MKQLEPASGQLTSLLGENPQKTRSALGAVLPTLLAGFAGNAESPEGVKRLNAAVEEADDDPGARLAAMLKGEAPPQDSLGLLGGLLGGGGDVVSKLTGTLARFLGVNEASLSKLVAIAVPLVLAHFKKQKREQALDDAGLGRFVAGQKSEIAQAMPDGLGKLLAGTSGLGALGSMTRGLFDSPADTVKRDAPPAATAATTKSPMLSKIVPILVLILVAFLLWKLVGGTRGERTPNLVPPTAENTAEAVQLLVTDATSALSGVTDVASARAALPELESLSGRLASLEDGFEELDPAARSRFSKDLDGYLGGLRSRADKVMAIPGVSDVLGPKLEAILGKLEEFADQ